jgi:hypothetical protein
MNEANFASLKQIILKRSLQNEVNYRIQKNSTVQFQIPGSTGAANKGRRDRGRELSGIDLQCSCHRSTMVRQQSWIFFGAARKFITKIQNDLLAKKLF